MKSTLDLVTGQVTELETPCLLVAAFADRDFGPLLAELDSATAGLLSRLRESGDLRGRHGECRMLYSPPGCKAERLLILGLGKHARLTRSRFQRALAAAAKATRGMRAEAATLALDDLQRPGLEPVPATRLAALAWIEASYLYQTTVSDKSKIDPTVGSLRIRLPEDARAANMEAAIAQAHAMGYGANLAKQLANLPPNVCNPEFLASEAKTIAQTHPKASLEVLSRDDMERLGMGALLAVARGSANPPRLIILRYQGGAKGDAPVVLVGKGVTFDSGGISLKPGANMHEMKYDMGGAASVLGAFAACLQLDLPLNLAVIVPSVENMPGGAAYRPGDIVTSLSGKTIEILNTDAEGRMILCDALTYAQNLEPAVLIDVATLTGACVVALGHEASGVMSRDPELSQALVSAGEQSGDRAWPLPLWEVYEKSIDSVHADMGNVGGRDAGSITAGCFLGRFTEGQRWAHIDIAGTAWTTGRKGGATGRPVALLTQYLINLCP